MIRSFPRKRRSSKPHVTRRSFSTLSLWLAESRTIRMRIVKHFYAVGGVSSLSAVLRSLSILTGLLKYSLTPRLSAYILWRALIAGDHDHERLGVARLAGLDLFEH